MLNSSKEQNVTASACTIDEQELLTVFDFYHNLDDKKERRIEANIDWNIGKASD